MLLSTSNVSSQPTTQNTGMSGQVAPETGDFDFLTYLLGLQVTPENSDTAEVLAGLGKDEKTEEQLSSMQLSNEAALWNPLFPGLGQAQNMNPADVLSENVEGDMSSKAANQGELSEALFSVTQNASAALLPEAGNADAKAGINEVSNQNLAFQRYGDIQKQASGSEQVSISSEALIGSEQATNLNIQNDNNLKLSDLDSEIKADPQSQGMFNSAVSLTGAQVKVDALETAPTANHKSQHVTIPEVMNRVESLVQSGGGKMTVTLNPPDLGKVEIEVMTRGKNVEISMTSEKQMTKSMLEGQFSELKQSMQAHDLQLSKVEVHLAKETSVALNDGRQFAGSHNSYQQSQGQSNQHESRSFSNQREFAPQSRQIAPMPAMASSRNFGGGSGVDLRI